MSVKIFLSAVSAEFADYREELRRDLTRHNVEVKIQEDFKDSGSDTLDKLDLYISHCDAVVHLAGDMTGSNARSSATAAMLLRHPDLVEKLPPLREALTQGEGISYTQWEAWLAAYHGKTLLIAQADATASRAEKYAPTPEQKASQQLHLQRLSEIGRYPGFTFRSPENLARQLAYTAVLDLIAREAAAKLRPPEPVHHSREFPLASIVVVLALLLLTPVAADRLTAMFGLTLGVTAWLIGGIGGAGLALAYLHYFGVLGHGAAAEGSAERLRYDSLRAGVAAGGMPTMLYSRWLAHALDAVDRFFGDAGKADQTLFPRAFGLKTPAPLWTAASFDTCLLLGLIYPIVTILLVWGLSGHVGPAEKALALPPGAAVWQRALSITVPILAGCIIWFYRGAPWWRSSYVIAATAAILLQFITQDATSAATEMIPVVAMALAPLCVLGLFVFAKRIAPDAFALKDVTGVALDVAGAYLLAIASTLSLFYFLGWVTTVAGGFIIALAIAAAVTRSGLVAFIVATASAGAFLALSSWLNNKDSVELVVLLFAMFATPPLAAGLSKIVENIATRKGYRGLVLLLLTCVVFLACLFLPIRFSSIGAWQAVGPIVLFLGLLTILNAPFDWISLGLTRVLLRRGLELGGWWPYLLAIVDALLAGVIIALLALTMLVGVQMFEYLAARSGNPVLPVDTLLNGLAAHPEAPEYWWLYALLLSTMIPSLLNLVIGGTALARAAPGMTTLLLNHVPAGREVPAFDRAWVALVLTLQVAGGVVLGVVAQALLAIALIRYVMPTVGLGLLDMARAVAAFNLPGKIGALLGL